MTAKYTFLTVGICLLSFSTPALAGQPGNPQEKRDMVEFNREFQQALNGPSGFGKRMSTRATSHDPNAPFRNFGDYLEQMTGGPNPDNDSGSGND